MRGDWGPSADGAQAGLRDTLAAAAAGQEWALSAVYRDVHPRVIRYLGVLAPTDAERLAAETWREVVRHLDRLEDDPHALHAFALASARRRTGRLGRRRAVLRWNRHDREIRARAAEAFGVDDAMAGDGLRQALAAVGRLPRDQADVVLLRVLGELTLDEVAALVGRQPRTVRRLQRRALQALEWTMPRTAVAR